MKLGFAAAIATILVTSVGHAAPLPNYFTIRIEAPGIQETTATFDYVGVERFDGLSGGLYDTHDTDFGSSPIEATYSNLQVAPASIYGGAEGTGNFANVGRGSATTITFTQEGASGLNYFGYWLSALDAGNMLEFWSNGILLGTFAPADVIALVATNSDYYGNPTDPFLGEVDHEPFVFVNFFLEGGATFDTLVYWEDQSVNGAYESDNHTVGWWETQGQGTEVTTVSEPASTLSALFGLSLIGAYVYRARRRQV